MTLSFRDLAPAAEPWISSLAQTPLITQLNETVWVFALIEAGHLLFLSMLGGAVLALDLRLLGLVLPSEPAAEVERRTRPWFHAGLAGAVATGLAMGVMNAPTLYPSTAFFLKMVALLGAALFSYGVVRRVVRRGGRGAPGLVTASVAALGLSGFAFFKFATIPSVSPGALLVALAALALLIVATPRRRGLVAAGLASVLGLGWAASLALPDPSGGSVAATGPGLLLGSLALGVGALEAQARSRGGDSPLKLAAFLSILTWVTVAAAGRWIGFS